jgi:uncharacterized membrane protein YeiB
MTESPTNLNSRIKTLDVLRCFAVLGILLLNILKINLFQISEINKSKIVKNGII